ncbi:MAG: circularly permuted type 2 ATP-grasp protein [Candidatus Obscuribacterales bacterium]|nr:circularly permuted type 2 ATP-grasp protein [Candidatus Obscuribacterales bacterium]
MIYTLFDDFKKEQNLTERKYRGSNIFVFNQPSLHLLDPDEAVFQPINSEKLETYPELAWHGLARKVCDGSAYFLNSPVTDLINDKALYSFLPDLAVLLYGKAPALPVVDAVQAWSVDDPSAPDRQMLEFVRANQADFVITHRYLEGGLGIRVGAKETEAEWSSFLDTFVADRPYLYVYRKYFKMEPDVALRLLISSLGSDAQLGSEPEMALTDTVYGRFSPDGHITSETAWCFGVFAGDV